MMKFVAVAREDSSLSAWNGPWRPEFPLTLTSAWGYLVALGSSNGKFTHPTGYAYSAELEIDMPRSKCGAYIPALKFSNVRPTRPRRPFGTWRAVGSGRSVTARKIEATMPDGSTGAEKLAPGRRAGVIVGNPFIVLY